MTGFRVALLSLLVTAWLCIMWAVVVLPWDSLGRIAIGAVVGGLFGRAWSIFKEGA